MQITVLKLLSTYRYEILFPLAAVEGPVVSVAVGFLIHTGTLHLIPAYSILILGDLIPDSIYYSIGYWGSNLKFVKKILAKSAFLTKHFDTVNNFWHNHGWPTMFFGKLAYGMAIPFLISAGMVKMSYERFVSYALPITFLQYAVFISIGYAAGKLYETLSQYVGLAYSALGIFLIIFVAIYFWASKYAKRKVISFEEESLREEQQ